MPLHGWKVVLGLAAVLSFIAALVAGDVRYWSLRKLWADADRFMRRSPAAAEWVATFDDFWPYVARNRRFKIIGRNLNLLPARVQKQFRRVQVAQRAVWLSLLATAGCWLLVLLNV